MSKYVFALLFFMAMPAYAAEECSTADLSTLNQEQKNQVVAVCYQLSYANDPVGNFIPYISSNQVCFDTPSFNPSTVCSKNAMVTQYQANKDASDAATAAKELLRTEWKTLVSGLASDYTGWDAMTNAQKLDVMKKMLRIRDLEERLR